MNKEEAKLDCIRRLSKKAELTGPLRQSVDRRKTVLEEKLEQITNKSAWSSIAKKRAELVLLERYERERRRMNRIKSKKYRRNHREKDPVDLKQLYAECRVNGLTTFKKYGIRSKEELKEKIQELSDEEMPVVEPEEPKAEISRKKYRAGPKQEVFTAENLPPSEKIEGMDEILAVLGNEKLLDKEPEPELIKFQRSEINEKPLEQYMVKSIPRKYRSHKEYYEKMRVPIGKEWATDSVVLGQIKKKKTRLGVRFPK